MSRSLKTYQRCLLEPPSYCCPNRSCFPQCSKQSLLFISLSVNCNQTPAYSRLVQHPLTFNNLLLPFLIESAFRIHTGTVYNYLSQSALNDSSCAIAAGKMRHVDTASITTDTVATAGIDHIAFGMLTIPVLERFFPAFGNIVI